MSQHTREQKLEWLLDEIREFLDGQVDVVDGDYGQPAPNRAMQLVAEIDELIGGRSEGPY